MARVTIPDTQSVVPSKVYIGLIMLELASIGIKYQGSSTNPFQESSAGKLLFLAATFCHVIALTAKISLPTAIIFHVSGVTACDTLLWILVTEIWWYTIINVLLLLVIAFCFYYKHISELLTKLPGTCVACILVLKTCSKDQQKDLNANQMTDLEGQECIGAQMADLAAENTMLCTPNPFVLLLYSEEDSCSSFIVQLIPLFSCYSQPLKDQWSSNALLYKSQKRVGNCV